MEIRRCSVSGQQLLEEVTWYSYWTIFPPELQLLLKGIAVVSNNA
jgi:hypothetical protein